MSAPEVSLSLLLSEQVAEALLADPTLTVRELGVKLGYSAHHLIRTFKKHTGMTPKQFAQLQKLEQFKTEIAQDATISRSVFEAGFESSRALYERSSGFLGMRPRQYQQGGTHMTIHFAHFETPFGPVLLGATELGVCSLHFGAAETLLQQLQQEFPRATLIPDPEKVQVYREALLAYLQGETQTVELPLDVRGTDFQWKVWQALRSIPHGETRSYSQVASFLGEPTAVRAVARACASNEVALLIPCHRVVRSDGNLSGYRWGVERKQKLLDWEKPESRLF